VIHFRCTASFIITEMRIKSECCRDLWRGGAWPVAGTWGREGTQRWCEHSRYFAEDHRSSQDNAVLRLHCDQQPATTFLIILNINSAFGDERCRIFEYGEEMMYQKLSWLVALAGGEATKHGTIVSYAHAAHVTFMHTWHLLTRLRRLPAFKVSAWGFENSW